jgi:transcriptional regulator with XRE-family HTH domain
MSNIEDRRCALGKEFRESLLRVLRIAGETDEGGRGSLTQRELAERSGVSLTLVKKYLRDDAGAGHARLEAVGKMAAALGVPPAFLLMRRDDWVALATAVAVLLEQAGDSRHEAHAAQPWNVGPMDAAEKGLEYARAVKVLDRHRAFHPPQVTHAIELTEAGVAHTSAVPPYPLLSGGHARLALAMCAIVGTTTVKTGNGEDA